MTRNPYEYEDHADNHGCPSCGEPNGCPCLTDADAPIYCAHRRPVGEWCPECHIAAAEELRAAFTNAMRGRPA